MTFTAYPEIKFLDRPPGFNAPISLTPEVIQLLTQNKVDTSGLNEIHWPAGASNHAVARFVMPFNENPTEGDIERISFGGLEFNMFRMSMQALYLIGTPSTDSQGSLVLVEFVDDRYFWGMDSVNVGPKKMQHGINLAKPMDREDWLGQTSTYPLDGTAGAWKGEDVIQEILDWKSAGIGFNSNEWTGLNLLSASGMLGEYHFTGQPLGEVIDYVLQAYGCVLCVIPNVDVAESGKRYQIQTIKSGALKASYALNMDSVISGGFKAEFVTSYLPGAPSPASHKSEVPQGVEVHFPTTVQEGKYRADMTLAEASDADIELNDMGDFNFTTDRWRGYESTSGRGSHYNSKPMTKSIYSHQWAIYEAVEDSDGLIQYELKNGSELAGLSHDMSKHYYSRFSCGACDVEIRDILGGPNLGGYLTLWAGAQEVVWSIGPDGPKTSIRGEYHCPLFGFVDNKPLKQSDIHSVGDARALNRSSGGVLIESRKTDAAPMDFYLAEITEVFGPNEGWDIIGYSARAYTNPALTEEVIHNMVPERMHDPVTVDIIPALEGAVCIIGVIPPGGLKGVAGRKLLYDRTRSGSSLPELLNSNGLDINRQTRDDSVVQLQAIAQMFGPISPVVSSGIMSTYPVSPGTFNSSKQRYSRNRGRIEGEPEYVLFVWEFPRIVQCSASPPPDDGRRSDSDAGFYGSYLSRMHGY